MDRLLVPTGWLPKRKLIVLSSASVPVPFKLTVCGLGGALSLTLRAAIRRPIAVGLKPLRKSRGYDTQTVSI